MKAILGRPYKLNLLPLLAVVVLVIPLFTRIKQAAAIDGETIYAGTPASFNNVDDAVDGPKNLGFTFNYFGTDYTTAYISTNGVLTFSGPSTAYSNDATGLNNSIMGFWDDLILSTGSNVYYKTIGSAGSHQFIVQWTNMFFFSTTITMGTFQIILSEGSNNIQIQYRDLLGGSRSNGNSATIGIRGSSTGSIFSVNTAVLSEGQALLYTPNGSGGYNSVNSAATYELVYLQDSNAPDSPSLNNPFDASTGVTVAPTFEWEAAANATSYNILISTVSDFSSTVVNQTGISGTSYTLGSALAYNTTYYWRVAAVNSYGTNLSSSRTFITAGSPNSPPNTPSSVTTSSYSGGKRLNTAGLGAGSLQASLSDSDSGQQVRYRLQISSDNSFTSPIVDYRSAYAAQGSANYTYGQSGGSYLNGSSATILSDGDYYVRLRAEDDASASSNWYTISGVAFTVDNTAPSTPAKPTQLGSSDAATGSATIAWTATDDNFPAAAPYLFDYSLAADFSAYTTISTNLTQTTLSGLSPDTYYYVRVRVVDSAGNISIASTPLVVYIPAAPILSTATPAAVAATPVKVSSRPTPTITPPSTALATTTPQPSPETITLPTQTVIVLVTDKQGNPIAGAKVTLHSTPRVAYTDASGNATFHDVEYGSHQAIVEYNNVATRQAIELAKPSSELSAGPTKDSSPKVVNAKVTIELPLSVAASSRTVSAWYWWLALLIIVGLGVAYLRRRRNKS